jgi:hypothetical protein
LRSLIWLSESSILPLENVLVLTCSQSGLCVWRCRTRRFRNNLLL